MAAGVAPLVPAALTLGQALERSQPLGQLRARLADSQARFDAIRRVVPAPLQPHLRPGPVDDEGWTLIAASASVAAKLRHWQPALEGALRQHGWAVAAVRIRVAGR